MQYDVRSRDDWNRRAGENAYHWVLAREKNWGRERYYQTGDDDVEKYILPFCRSGTALDIGCGTGRVTRAMAKFFSVTGIDVSDAMLKRAREDNPGLTFLPFVSDFPCASDAFDFCWSFLVFQHIQRKQTIWHYFREIHRVLKKNGKARVQVRCRPGNPPGRVLWWRSFDRCYIALVLWRGLLPILWLRPYDTVWGACFKPEEFRRLGYFASVRSFMEGGYLWVELVK